MEPRALPAAGQPAFDPPVALAAAANAQPGIYAQAERDRLAFWSAAARRLTWSEDFSQVLDWSNPPFARWFAGGKLNVAYNCVDRHVERGLGDKVAIHFVGEPGDRRDITYAELKDEVGRAANALERLGVGAGDRVAIYLPMIPEAIVAMLACARIGAPHTVVFGGFSADALASRIEDFGARLVITADGGYRRGRPAALKPAVDDALAKLGDASPVEHVLVVRRTAQDVGWHDATDRWWHELVDGSPAEHQAQPFDSEYPLFVMYTSGTTGKPKGIIAEHRVTLFYTAPTAIRTCMKWGEQIPAGYDLSSLRVLGSVGEPINPEAYLWYREHVGGGRTPVVDTWWQTETGAHMITPLPGVTAGKPGAAMTPFPGIGVDVVDDHGTPVADGESGYLVVTEPWPSMLRTIWADDERYRETYWSRFASQGYYFAGDGAKRDDDGAIWLLGRVDDVMNVSSHRLSSAEIESALVSHPSVAEAAVVGAADPTTGQAVVAFVILRQSAQPGEGVADELRQHVAREIGPIAKPRRIVIVPELPKTRSGKIMRRLLRDVAEDREVGDATTLADGSVMDLIAARIKTAPAED